MCNQLIKRIYEQNKELGWHDEMREDYVFTALFHSEVSEAVEGLRKNLMDDHLPQYEMWRVELVDFIIRVFDYYGLKGYSYWWTEVYCSTDLVRDMTRLHKFIAMDNLDDAVSLAALLVGDDWEEILEAKVAYNKHRADHKREARASTNGKKF